MSTISPAIRPRLARALTLIRTCSTSRRARRIQTSTQAVEPAIRGLDDNRTRLVVSHDPVQLGRLCDALVTLGIVGQSGVSERTAIDKAPNHPWPLRSTTRSGRRALEVCDLLVEMVATGDEITGRLNRLRLLLSAASHPPHHRTHAQRAGKERNQGQVLQKSLLLVGPNYNYAS